MYPFLKWVGGKRRSAEWIASKAPKSFDTYWEPFLGSGAVFFALHGRFKRAVLSDTNPDLVQCWYAVKNWPEELIELLNSDLFKYDKDTYYEVRGWKREEHGVIRWAARTIFLNKTCYNGLWRVNKKGEFNVPFGKYTNPSWCDPENIHAVAKALENVELNSGPFTGIKPAPGDFAYFDPPYLPRKEDSFSSYTKGDFPLEEQEKLAKIFTRLGERGIKALLSNADVPAARELFGRHTIHTTSTVQSVSCGVRKDTPDILAQNWSDDEREEEKGSAT